MDRDTANAILRRLTVRPGHEQDGDEGLSINEEGQLCDCNSCETINLEAQSKRDLTRIARAWLRSFRE